MKRIIQSSVMLLAVAAVVVGSTGAFFSSQTASTGNVFTAGNIDLKVNHSAQTYNGVNCQTCGVTIYSSTNTQVVAANAAAAYQGPFPIDAALVTSPNAAWLNAAAVAPAQWIWVTSTVNAADTTNNAEYTFADTFFLQGPIALSEFELSIASDNGYRIVVNGQEIVNNLGATGTFTFNNLNPLTSAQQDAFQAALIQNGQNTLEITVRNLSGNSNPARNPAGLIYKIEFTNEDCEAGVADFQQMCELWQATDLTTERFFNFSDVKPQDQGTNLISMVVESNESYLCLALNNKEEVENDVITPEATAGDITPAVGELGEFLTVAGWYSDANGVKDAPLFPPTAAADLGAITYADGGTPNGPVPPGVTQYVQLEWCLGEMTVDGTTVTCDGVVPNINQTQTDAFLADLQFFAIQSRNNADFTCADVVFGVDDEENKPEVLDVAESDLAQDLQTIINGPTKWFFFEDGSGIVNPFMTLNQYAPGGENNIGVGPEGVGAVKMLLHDNSRYNIATYQFAGTPLASITNLRYRIYDASPSGETPYLHFNADFDGDDDWQSRLVMVPSATGNAGVPANTWTTVDAIDGGNALWCWSGMSPCGGSGTQWPTESGTPFSDATAPYQTWADIVAAYPGIALRTSDPFFGVRVGHPGPSDEEGYVDWIEVNAVQYNFEN